MNVKEKIIGMTGTLSGATSILGSYQLCHSICTAFIALLALIGITVVGMPLLFLTKVALPFWIIGATMLAAMFLLSQLAVMRFSQNMMLANAGLLVAGMPFNAVSRFQTLLWILGAALVITSIIWTIQGRRTKGCCA
ncbi:hypothetical protein HY485_05010 [Candidatus Woesearchaeota archaeon]|nr:hypothetical protein [Candidatus Woesearchaeota archaeon]